MLLSSMRGAKVLHAPVAGPSEILSSGRKTRESSPPSKVRRPRINPNQVRGVLVLLKLTPAARRSSTPHPKSNTREQSMSRG